jgi:hypothetical protein
LVGFIYKHSIAVFAVCKVMSCVVVIPTCVGAGTAGVAHPSDPASGKVLTGDLDSSLASLAQNLSINKGSQVTVKLVHLLIQTCRTMVRYLQ